MSHLHAHGSLAALGLPLRSAPNVPPLPPNNRDPPGFPGQGKILLKPGDPAPGAYREPGAIGVHFHIAPVPETLPAQRIKNCAYPVLIHVTPDNHCTGALTLYASIVRNVLLQPKKLQNKTCVYFTFVDQALGIEDMYLWKPRENPFEHVADCKAISDKQLENWRDIVPFQWQGLAPIEVPSLMRAGVPNWVHALNRIHSWAFDLYDRALYMDADSILVTDLALIFEEGDPRTTIYGGADQYWSCHDRGRLNGGLILLRPSRYFHVVALELLHDPTASCLTGKWQQSEQELLNCICGYTYSDRVALTPARPEFACGIMPMWNSVWPRNYPCSDANVKEIRSIHFTASKKPWNVPEGLLAARFDTGYWGCVRNAARVGNIKALKACSIPGREETRLVKMEGHFEELV